MLGAKADTYFPLGYEEHGSGLPNFYLHWAGLAFWAGILLVFLASFTLLLAILAQPLRHVPGPILCKVSRLYLVYFDLSLKRTDKIHQWHLRHGSVICIGPGEISLSDPLLMRQIYSASSHYAKSSFFDHFGAFDERPLFSVIPPTAHREKRRLIASFYHNLSTNKLGVESLIHERANALVRQVDKHLKRGSASMDFYPLANNFAFDNVSRLLYGPRHCSYAIENEGEDRQILESLKKAQFWDRIRFDLPWVYSVIQKLLASACLQPECLEADAQLMRWIEQKFAEAAADSATSNEDCLLNRLMQAKDVSGDALSQNYIVAELYDNLNAAQVTVAVTLTYIIYQFSCNHAWQSRIPNELRSIFDISNGLPSFAQINDAPLLDACIREVHRLYPGTGGHAERVVPKGGKVYNGVYIPGGVSTF